MSAPDYFQSASQLMKAMGEEKGLFDATPPRLHDSLLDIRESEKIRILGVLLAHTVRNGPKGMSAVARDAHGHRLKPWQIGRLAHMKKQNVGPALQELIGEGKIARDEDGGFRLRGDVPPPRLESPVVNPQSSNLYKLLPDYLKPCFEQLALQDQNRFLSDLKAIGDWEDEAHRESLGVIRDQSTQFRQYLFASIDVKAKKLERKKEKKAVPKLLDRLKVKPPELSFVQITFDFEFVQNQNGHSHKLQNDFVQNGHPLVDEIKTETTTTEALRTPSPAPLLLVTNALAEYGHPDPGAAAALVGRCREQVADATETEIVHFIHVKGDQITDRVQNPVGLLLASVSKQFHRGFRDRLPETLRKHRTVKLSPTDPFEARKQAAREEFMRRTLEDLEDERKQREDDGEAVGHAR